MNSEDFLRENDYVKRLWSMLATILVAIAAGLFLLFAGIGTFVFWFVIVMLGPIVISQAVVWRRLIHGLVFNAIVTCFPLFKILFWPIWPIDSHDEWRIVTFFVVGALMTSFLSLLPRPAKRGS